MFLFCFEIKMKLLNWTLYLFFRVIFVSIFIWISLSLRWLLNSVLFKKNLVVLYFVRVCCVSVRVFFFTFLDSCLLKTYSNVSIVLYDSCCFIMTVFSIVNYWSLWFVCGYLYKTLTFDILVLKKVFLMLSYYIPFILFQFYVIYNTYWVFFSKLL